MSKIKTKDQLQNSLDKDFAWRLKEIANLKIAVRTSENLSKKTVVRAAIPLLYGHWEGFIKKASTYYLEYVNGQSLPYNELKSCFIVFGVKKKINDLVSSKNSAVSISTLDFLRGELNQRANLKIESAIRTEFNLSSKVFENIASSIGINTASYESRYHLIDESLLNRRNHIAHGEYLDIDTEGFRGLADEILNLLRTYKTDIENSVSLERYKISA
ncbi:MAG: MAE_28990/MAE_18760 family HEPN-like nuclease [Pseudomonas sp.]|uniref:MAE_28990/MAE_18760 family HEPN-like nuclease n=1 Tax=Pseudomonas sp. TaxID=306 RepID=UPI002718E859|nr:MAE_28990/MAE_18760 family HEPN-like nuclease [Pseudomonas sp.]MDO9617242.1 MAE_28990/MAE_18760 family HEPN-like nuclease [Pseudomonas sp.]MDP2444824.1 MAE_28990/MAE_18760 family HEPN-like nuclease [Pseudomonas sp.]MDZ4336717.1 MAE_28990/MAE_18760 family HEPN-like nuclease [Pseudomonas sp.]